MSLSSTGAGSFSISLGSNLSSLRGYRPIFWFRNSKQILLQFSVFEGIQFQISVTVSARLICTLVTSGQSKSYQCAPFQLVNWIISRKSLYLLNEKRQRPGECGTRKIIKFGREKVLIISLQQSPFSRYEQSKLH